MPKAEQQGIFLKTVLIGWELGAGRGHVERLIPIVAAYRTEGWNVIAALRNALLGAEILGPHQHPGDDGKLTITRAPIFSHFGSYSGPVNSLAEVLVKTGFASPNFVRPLLTEWEAILARWRPDLIISDASPSLNMVVRGRVPLIVIGNGWTVPPDSESSPPLVSGKGDEQAIRDADEATLTAMCAVCSFPPKVSRFTDLLRGDFNMVCTLDEIDPYRGRRDEPLCWPFEIPAPVAPTSAARLDGLIYLPKAHPARAFVERGLAGLGARFEAYFNDQPLHPSSNVVVHTDPIDFTASIPGKQIVIHHGGLGTTIWCMANRVPQLIFPNDLEKMLIARGVVESGFGYAANAQTKMMDLKPAIDATSNLTVPNFAIDRMATLSPKASIAALMSRRF